MNRILPKILFTLLLTVAVHSSARADRPWVKWSPEDGYPLRAGYHIEWFRSMESRYEGELVGEIGMAWSDCRWTETQTGDRGVFIQIFGTDGNPKFATGGIRVSDAPNRQENPVIYPSSDGGWYVTWNDFDADSLGDIYCNKISADGHRLWSDTERGLAVCALDGIQEDMRITDDGQGGCIIAWRDKRGGDPADIYAQHILANGTVDGRWPQNGMPVVTAVGSQDSHTADTDGAGGMIIGWKDGRLVGNFDIWAQRITPDGRLLWGAGQGLRVCATASNQEDPKVCPDGAGGAFFCWVDDRNLDQTGKDLYAQRVDRDGNLLWPQDGEIVCNVAREQAEPRIVYNYNVGEAIVTWEDKRGDDLTYDIYSMKISGANRLRKDWNVATGVPVVIMPRNQGQVRLFPDAQGGTYYVWEDERNGGFPEVDIYAQHFNRDGQRLWAENGIPVCTVPGNQNSPIVRRTADGGCVITWADYRTGSLGLWSQRFNYDGQAQGQQDGSIVVQGIGGNGLGPKVIYRGDNTFTTFWLDGRYGGSGTVPFIQTARNAGDHLELLLPVDGAPVMTGTTGGGINPDAVNDGAGGTIIAWEDHRVGDIYSIYAQRLQGDGQPLWGASGVKVADYDYEQIAPQICTDGSQGCFVAWRAPSDAGDNDIFMQRLDANGQRMFGARGITIANTSDDEMPEELIPDGQGGSVITWIKSDSVGPGQTDDNILATRVNSDGQILWNDGDGSIHICDAQGKQRTSKIIQHPSGFVMAWVDGRDDHGDGMPGNDIYAQFINPDGTFRWHASGELICNADQHQDNPVLAFDNLQRIWCVWEDHRNIATVQQRDIYMQKMDWQYDTTNHTPPHLKTYFEPDGTPVCNARYNQQKPFIASDGQNGLWVTWEDYQNGGVWSDIFATHLQPDGTPYQGWQQNGNMICGAFHKQETPQIANLTRHGESGAVVIWEDKRATGKEELSNVYCQRMEGAPLAVSPNRSEIPFDFYLKGIYPNPFNSTTILTYSVARDGQIRVSLFDAVGRLVREVSRESVNAGTHRVVINGQGLASGSYVVRVESGSSSIERAVRLVK